MLRHPRCPRLVEVLATGMALVAVFGGYLAAAEGTKEPNADPAAFSPEQEKFFEEKVRPLLAARCVECHGPAKQESGLRLDARESVLAGGDSGEKAVVPGSPEQSLLLRAVRRQGDYKMPPKETLPADEVQTLARWIELGLPWGRAAPPAEPSMEERHHQARREHWAFQPIRRPDLPAVKKAGWPNGGIDRFILARLETAGLAPSPEADRRTLVRRASFDLVGLPPAPEEVEAFVSDPAPDAYERLIERLLASPRYGERWGRHWLDVARYADTRGYSFGRERNFPYAYTYRDYVIGAYNSDLPFDRFVLEQLAADLLPPGKDNWPLAGLGFLTVGRKYNNRHDDIDDQIDVVTRGLLGLTVACARCHDHKYDAIPTEDYYSLYGVFASCQQPDELPFLGDPTQTAGYADFQAELDKRRRELDDFQKGKHRDLVNGARERVTDYLARVASGQSETLLQKLPFISLSPEELRPRLVERWRKYIAEKTGRDHPVFGPWHELVALPEERFSEEAPAVLSRWTAATEGSEPPPLNPLVRTALAAEPPRTRADMGRVWGKLLEQAHAQWKQAGGKEGQAESAPGLPPDTAQLVFILIDKEGPLNIPLEELREYLTRADRNRQQELKKKIDEHEARSPGAPPRAMIVSDAPRPVQPRVFLRGNQDRPGKEVPRQYLRVVAEDEREPFTLGSGRLELAREIVAAGNPLTARVIANRVWMHHFGAALVNTPSDFGIRSEPPTHSELLDYLACELRDGGWSLKALHRRIMLSAAYRQASVDRPECRAVDPENRLAWRMNRRRLEFEPLRDALVAAGGRLETAMGGRPGDITAPAFRRRAVYGFIDRQDLPSLLRVFDFASPDQSSPGRPRTTVPQQALFLMNSEFVIDQARALAARTANAPAQDDAQRLAALYAVVYGRPPRAAELEHGQNFVRAASEAAAGGDSGQAKLGPWEQYAQLLLLSNEFAYVD